MVQGDAGLAEALADAGTLQAVKNGEVLIEQNDTTNDIYFIVAGIFAIYVNERRLYPRHAGDTVGEMATVSPI